MMRRLRRAVSSTLIFGRAFGTLQASFSQVSSSLHQLLAGDAGENNYISHELMFVAFCSKLTHISPALLHQFDTVKGLTVDTIKTFLNDLLETPACHLLFEELC